MRSKYVYKEYHSVCPLVGNGTLPTSLSPAWGPPPPPRTGGGGVAHTPAGEGLGESQFRQLENKLSALPTLCPCVNNINVNSPENPSEHSQAVCFSPSFLAPAAVDPGDFAAVSCTHQPPLRQPHFSTLIRMTSSSGSLQSSIRPSTTTTMFSSCWSRDNSADHSRWPPPPPVSRICPGAFLRARRG